ncbi:MAG TPA: GNAT family N-acetyltransferase [Candidatus Lustribacter sp.]|nr:GNAT family N-acetyltransferase [Candidatus Lustribacter sp.]
MRATALGLTTDLMILRLGGSEVQDCGDHLVVRSPHNPTFWWGNLIALPRPPAAETVPDWLDRFTEAFPSASHRAFGVDHAPADPAGPETPWTEPWVAAGFTYEPSTVLTTDSVRPPPFPNPDAVCRPLESASDWAALLEVKMANNDRHSPEGYRTFALNSITAYRRMAEGGHGQWFGAFIDGRLRSTMGLFTDGSGLARFQSVDTHPDARRQGLAGTLVHHVGTWGLGELGASRLVMVADPSYVAIRLYRALGFVDAEPEHQLERPSKS